jgi:dTDP-4-dehydrorhamnose reductase
MNILLTGAAGQLGNELLPLLSTMGKVVATDLKTPPGASKQDWVGLDISDAGKLETLLNRLRPELIVNTAAYTAVDQAESDPETCFGLNATLPLRLAGWTKRNHARLIHYSTDYVFDGKSNVPYRETDQPDPQNVYGDSKLAGETAIATSGCKHVILRTSWVYSSHGKNFVLSMLELARKGLALKIVNDQRGCPTWAHNLALASHAVIQKWQESDSESLNGVFHYCDDQAVSWFDFARQIFSLAMAAGLLQDEPALTPVPSSDFPQPAERPKWSVLDAQRIAEVFSIHPLSFEQSLQSVIAEIKSKDYS